jgi:hypothetical protein
MVKSFQSSCKLHEERDSIYRMQKEDGKSERRRVTHLLGIRDRGKEKETRSERK